MKKIQIIMMKVKNLQTLTKKITMNKKKVVVNFNLTLIQCIMKY